MFKKCTDLIDKNNNLGQSNSLPIMCVLKRACKTGIAALSVAIPCASQKIVQCMIWAV